MLYALASCGMGLVMLMGPNGPEMHKTFECAPYPVSFPPPFVSKQAFYQYWRQTMTLPSTISTWGDQEVTLDCHSIDYLVEHPQLPSP